MSKQAHMADGTILEFPDDTPDHVIDAAVKQHIAAMPKVGDMAPDPGMADAPDVPRYDPKKDPFRNESVGRQISDASFGLLHNTLSAVHGVAQGVENVADVVNQRVNPITPLRNYIHNATLADNAVMAKDEADYQSGPNGIGAYIGGAAGNTLPYVVGPAGKAIGAVGEKAASMLPARFATPLAKRVASGAAQGLAVGAAQPVTGQGDYWDQKRSQLGLAALVGGGLPIATNALAALGRIGQGSYNALANPNAAAASKVAALFADDPNAAAKLSAPQTLAGYNPTAAEAYASGGAPNALTSAKLVKAERNARNVNGDQFNAQDAANDAARSTALQNLAGSDTALEAAKAARTAATRPFIDANLKPAQVADRWGSALKVLDSIPGGLGKDTTAAVIGARKIIKQVISGKELNEDDAVSALQDLKDSIPEKVGGGPSVAMQAFDAAQAAIDKNMHPVQPILDAIQTRLNSGIGMHPTVGGALRSLYGDLSQAANTRGMVSGDILDGARQNVNLYLAKHAPNGYFSNKETAGIAPVKAAISNFLESRVPGFGNYLAAYAKGSQPITDMESVRGLLDKVGLRGSNSAGNPRATLTQLASLLKSDDAARYPMSDKVRQQVENILSTLQARSTINNVTGASGPGTAAETIASQLANRAPRAVGSGIGAGLGYLLGHATGLPEAGDFGLGALGLRLGDAVGGSIQSRNANALARLLQSPQAAATAIKAQQQPNKLIQLLMASPQGRALLQSPQARALLPSP